MPANIAVKRGLYFFVLIFAMTACGGANKTSNSKNGDQSSNETPEKETYDLTMNVAYPPPSDKADPKTIAIEKFAELVKERTE
jgi:TRAP-type C4-dicarboxylate transport system substrate-binding protein